VKSSQEGPDDSQDLLVLYREGHPQAFRRLVDRFQDRMLQFFYRLCWDRDRAEDLTQDLFLKLIQGCRRYRPEGKLSTFVYRVATNLWIDHYRARRPQPRLYSLDQAVLPEAMDPAGSGPSPVEQASADEEKDVLRHALEALTEPHRLVFELAVYQERPYAEISELLDIPIGTVKSRMHNSVQALKQLLGQQALGDQAPAQRGQGKTQKGGPPGSDRTFPKAARRVVG